MEGVPFRRSSVERAFTVELIVDEKHRTPSNAWNFIYG